MDNRELARRGRIVVPFMLLLGVIGVTLGLAFGHAARGPGIIIGAVLSIAMVVLIVRSAPRGRD
jgi:hypothetical protein